MLNIGVLVLTQFLTLRHLGSPIANPSPSSAPPLLPLSLLLLQSNHRHHPHQRSLVKLCLRIHNALSLGRPYPHSLVHLPHQAALVAAQSSHYDHHLWQLLSSDF